MFSIQHSDFDTNIFGVRCGKLDLTHIPYEPSQVWLDALAAETVHQGYALVFVKTQLPVFYRIDSLKSGAFDWRLSDIKMDLACTQALGVEDPHVKEAPAASDLARIKEIAFEIARGSRFVEAFGEEHGLAVYSQWATHALEQFRCFTLRDETGGMLSALLAAQPLGKTVDIALMGVHRDAQFGGLGPRLLQSATTSLLKSFSKITVSTRYSNSGAIRMYQRAGYLIERVRMDWILRLNPKI